MECVREVVAPARDANAPSADLRRDRLTGRTSLIVPRWNTAKAADPVPLPLELPAGSSPCPFCPEQMRSPEASAGEETARVPDEGSGWSALALRNRWPHTLDPNAAEVVVLSSQHDAHLGSMPLDAASSALRLMFDRAGAQRRRGLEPLLFVNHGVNAGSSQPHPHGQVIGLPAPDPQAEVERSALRQGDCVLCEHAPDDRFVARLAGACVLTSEAPSADYEQLVVQSSHRSADPRALAEGIGVAIRALYDLLGPVAYNLLLHVEEHPHVHITPRTARHSGYSLAGIHTCYVDPATANDRLAEKVAEGVQTGSAATEAQASSIDAA